LHHELGHHDLGTEKLYTNPARDLQPVGTLGTPDAGSTNGWRTSENNVIIGRSTSICPA
jgi:hypothetical protein